MILGRFAVSDPKVHVGRTVIGHAPVERQSDAVVVAAGGPPRALLMPISPDDAKSKQIRRPAAQRYDAEIVASGPPLPS
jgi:hypothetical protein